MTQRHTHHLLYSVRSVQWCMPLAPHRSTHRVTMTGRSQFFAGPFRPCAACPRVHTQTSVSRRIGGECGRSAALQNGIEPDLSASRKICGQRSMQECAGTKPTIRGWARRGSDGVRWSAESKHSMATQRPAQASLGALEAQACETRTCTPAAQPPAPSGSIRKIVGIRLCPATATAAAAANRRLCR